MASLAQRVAEQYPYFTFLLKDPQVGPLLRKAVDPSTGGWSPLKFQSELYKTKWFRTRSQKARELEILKNTDPAEYQRRINNYRTQIQNQAAQLGLRLNRSELRFMALGNIAQGIDVGSPEWNFRLMRWATQHPSRFASGIVRGAVNQARQLARGQYYVNLGKHESYSWGVQMAMGYKDQAALQEHLTQKAIHRYPHLAEQLRQGKTMEDLFSGHRQLIADELELDPDTINMGQSRWSTVIDRYDQKTKTHRPWTLAETRVLARQDPRFWHTTNGRGMDAGLTDFFLKEFGRRA